MSELEVANTQSTAVSPAAPKERPVAQATSATLADVPAASEAISPAEKAPKATLWKPILVFFLFVYASSVAVAGLLGNAPSWVRLLLLPLFPVLCATTAFWWRQKWKFRAKDCKFKLKIWEDALDAVGHEAVNAVNAIRANLIGFRLANPQVNYPEHLEIIEEGASRIDSVVQKAQNPVAWKGTKKKKKKEETTPTQIGEDTRSRISL